MPNGEPTGAETPKAGGATLEQKLSIFDSIGKSLEDLVGAVREIPKVVSKAAYYTYYTVKAALGLAAGVALAGAPALIGAPVLSAAAITNVINAGYHALILPVGMAAGTWLSNLKNKTKTTYKQISNELSIGGLLGGILSYIFIGNNVLGNVVKSSYGTAASLAARGTYCLSSLPVFLGVHELLNRALISDYKPQPFKDMGKRIKKMWPIIPPLVANYTYVPDYLGHSYQMPVAAGISTAYGLLKSEPKKEEKKESPSPYGLPPGYAMPKPA